MESRAPFASGPGQAEERKRRSPMKRLVLHRGLGVVCVLAVAALGHAAAADFSYVGAKKCKACHLKEFKSWSETKMANAFELLKPGVSAQARTKAKLDPAKDYTTDSTCPPAHNTR